MVLNSLLSLIIISPVEKITKLVTTFCESVVKAQLHERFGVVKLRVYLNISQNKYYYNYLISFI